MDSGAADIVRWAASGAMWLTGPATAAPSVAPAALAGVADAAAEDLARQTARWGTRVEVDGAQLLGERAAITRMTRKGPVSVGGSARFVAVLDGWVVLNLPRPEDVAALPALVSLDVSPDDWPAIEGALAAMPGTAVVDQASLLGLAASVPGEVARPASPGRELASGGPRQPSASPLVVDLTSLWAGPLAASLLGQAGARVVKVESASRPDGARGGATAFYDLLNHGKECLDVDLREPDDIRLLRSLIAAADLVIEGSRPRVMDELGIDPAAAAELGTNWVSITAHGRTGAGAQRVGFGDDAAVAGGIWLPGEPPGFVADAVADPLTGLIAAVFAADLLAGDTAAVVEVPLARAAAWAAGPAVDAPVRRGDDEWVVEVDGEQTPVARPRHRPLPGRAAPLGAHSVAVRAEFADR